LDPNASRYTYNFTNINAACIPNTEIDADGNDMETKTDLGSWDTIE